MLGVSASDRNRNELLIGLFFTFHKAFELILILRQYILKHLRALLVLDIVGPTFIFSSINYNVLHFMTSLSWHCYYLRVKNLVSALLESIDYHLLAHLAYTLVLRRDE